MDFKSLKKYLKSDLSSLPTIKLSIVGDTATQLLCTAIRGAGVIRGYRFNMFEADYNQVEQQVLDPTSNLHQYDAKYNIFFQSTHKLLEQYSLLPASEWGNLAEERLAFVRTICETVPGKIIYYNYPEIGDGIFGSFENKKLSDLRGEKQAKSEKWAGSSIVIKYPDSESGAALDRLPLGFQQSAAPKPLIDVIPGSVKLQEHNIQSGLAERLGIAGIFGKADAVGVHLGIAAPGLLRIAHQLRKVVPQGGFSPGKLQKRLAALPDDLPDCLFHLLRTGVFRIVPAVCEAVTAVQVTALRHLQQHAAAPALMLRADAAVRRAMQAAVLWHRLRPQKPLIEIQPAAPDGHRKAAVLRAALL